MHRHLDFRIPELESLYQLAMADHEKRPGPPEEQDCTPVPLPLASDPVQECHQTEQPAETAATPLTVSVESVESGGLGAPRDNARTEANLTEDPESACVNKTQVGSRHELKWRKPEGDPIDSPFFLADLPSDDVAAAIAKRSE